MTKNSYWDSLSKEEQKYQKDDVLYLQRMRDQREQPDIEKNNLSFSQLYDLNRKSDLAYSDMSPLVAQENEDESNPSGITKRFEMTSGATRQKDSSIVSHLKSFNFEPDIVAFDRDNKIVNDLGESVEDLISKSIKLEKWNNKQIDAQREFIAQGNVYIREVIIKKPIKIHGNSGWVVGNKISDYKKDKNAITKFEMCFERQLVLGKNVYLANMKERDIQKQPRVFTYEEMPLSQAKSIYGKWDRWKFVEETTKGNKQCYTDFNKIVQEDQSNLNWGVEGFWNINKPEAQIGIIHIYDNVEKTYMIYLNGIMMLPIGYSLYEISPSGMIPMGKGDAEIIPGYALAKGIPANTIVDTKMFDMVWNSMAQKMLQSAKPTMGNLSGHTISTNLLYSGRIANGIRPNSLFALLPPESRQIQSTETTFAQMAKEIIANKSVDDMFSGQPEKVDTATELLERKKTTILKLFSIVDGWKELERQLAHLRIASIFSYWTKYEQVPYFKDIIEVKDGVAMVVGKEKKANFKKKYRNELVETKFKDTGKQGMRDIRFFGEGDAVPNPDDMQSMQKMADEEELLSKKYGKPTRISYLNAQELSRLFEWHWYVDIRQSREDDSHLDLMVYIDAKTRVAQLFPDSLNKEYTLTKIAKIQNEDVDKAYTTGSPQAQIQGVMEDARAVQNPMDNVMASSTSLPKI